MSAKENFDRVSNVLIACISITCPTGAAAATAFKEVISRYLASRTEKASEILIRELKHADKCDELLKDQDSLIVRTARFHQAALIGAAHTNLRILARLVIHGDGTRAIPADEFLYLAQVIESLRHDELVVLAAFIRAKQQREKSSPEIANSSLWIEVHADLSRIYSERELGGLTNALLRTGFLDTFTDTHAGSDGGSNWYVTPILMRLEATTQFANAVAEADSSTTLS